MTGARRATHDWRRTKTDNNYSITCLKLPLKIDKTKVLVVNGSLMKVERIAECSPWSILQYFWPALSDKRSWKPVFGCFLSVRFKQVLLYC